MKSSADSGGRELGDVHEKSKINTVIINKKSVNIRFPAQTGPRYLHFLYIKFPKNRCFS